MQSNGQMSMQNSQPVQRSRSTMALGISFGLTFSTSSPFWSWMQETGQYRAQTEQSMHRSAWMTYFSALSPVIVWVGHLISQTPQPMHVSVMKCGIDPLASFCARSCEKYHKRGTFPVRYR